MIAVISDIHSNHLALKAVLEDIDKQGIEEIYCLGDLIGYAPCPDKIFPILKDSGIKILMGNYDEAVAFEKRDCGCGYTSLTSTNMGKISFEWTLKHTSKESKEWIKELPREIKLEVDGRKVLMVHGSPDNISGIIEPDFSDNGLMSIMEKADVDILFCGHIHLPFHKKIGDKHIINPGSVGRPRRKSTQAEYAIVDLTDGKCDVRFRLVDYDFESFAKEIEDSDMPENNFAEVIRTGYWEF